MKIHGKRFQAVWYEKNTVKLIDQRKLPWDFEIFSAQNVEQVAFAIKDMVVRGAPAIGAAAAYGMVLGSRNHEKTAHKLSQTRPTAHDLFHAINYMKKKTQDENMEPLDAAHTYVEAQINACKHIGEYGEALVKDGTTILTHCNAGALATVDYGTALAPLRFAHTNDKKFMVYVDETRPRLQGMLTAWELKEEGIDYALIADNAAGYFMRKKEIDMVIVGADRIAKNGDVANKIGTYQKAVVAHENNIPFYVAAPMSTFDERLEDGKHIPIEERGKKELTEINGKQILPNWTNVRNPAFDVTPAKLITGYITDQGIKQAIA